MVVGRKDIKRKGTDIKKTIEMSSSENGPPFSKTLHAIEQ